MTLLLRQMSAAFWLAFLIPVAMSLAIKAIGAPDWLAFTALGTYSVAALFMAHRQFLHLQDTGWSGAAVTFGRTKVVQEASLVRECVPWRALFRKEPEAARIYARWDCRAPFVLHLGAIALRKTGDHVLGETTRLALDAFGLVWIVVPFVAGSQKVSRKNASMARLTAFCVCLFRAGRNLE